LSVALACCVAASGAVAQDDGAAVIDALAAYEEALSAGSFFTSQTLSIADVAYSFNKNLAHMDTRESARIKEWYGVHQEGDAATVLYALSAMDVVFSHENTVRVASPCLHLNDGRWFCRATIDSMKIDAAFYIETPSETELAAQAAAAAPPSGTPTPPRP
jgi:hypothetical protein